MLKLSKPYIPEGSIKSLNKVLISGNLVQGENILAFERLLAEYLGVDHVMVVSSGTAALHLSLIALNITSGDEVIVPAYSFPAVANVVELVGARPVFVDISLNDFCIAADKIEEKITPRTKAIMPVHEFGQSADLQKITEIAKRYNLYVVEDAACAIGTRFNNLHVGTYGDLGCFSFHPRKLLTTGEGGAIVTKNQHLADSIRKLRSHGMHLVDGKYDFTLPGFNYRMTDFQAVLGILQLNEIDETIDIHRLQAQHYNQVLNGVDGIRFDWDYPNRFKTYQTYHLVLNDGDKRDRLKQALFNQGIESNIGAHAIPALTYYQNKYNIPATKYPNALTAWNQGLALPIGRHLSNNDVNYISSAIIKLYRNGF
jgi:perosamine synthetase